MNVLLKDHVLTCLKAFGDLTIAAGAIRTLYDEDAKHVKLWICSYHQELFQALSPTCQVEVLDFGSRDVPAFYDIKSRGISQAAISFAKAYHEIKRHKSNTNVLIFDSISWRERLLFHGFRSFAVSSREHNIYKNYHSTFLRLFGRVKEEPIIIGPDKTILILPSGRKNFRNIPADLINEMSKLCLAHGLKPKLYVLEGEPPIFCDIPCTIVAKPSFVDLRQAIEGSRAVISADSLSAHLANYVRRPVFVASPYSKTSYWLPPNTFDNDYWGLFSESRMTMTALERFLASLK